MIGTPQMHNKLSTHFDEPFHQGIPPSVAIGRTPVDSIKQTLTRPAKLHGGQTEPLTDPSSDPISVMARFQASFRVGAAAEYIPLPWTRRLRGVPTGAGCWRIELHGLGPNMGPLGLDILDDVVIGRGSDVDVDMEPYQGHERAVSRRHVMLRPTAHQLHLIDLGSTNGTFYNGVPLARCLTYTLKSQDVITLGLHSFTVMIVDGPLVAHA